MFSLDDIFDFLRRNLILVLGVLVFIVRTYGQYVESSKKAQLENQRKLETAQRQERANSFEGYLERSTATNLDDGRDDFSQTGQHNGPSQSGQQSTRQSTQQSTQQSTKQSTQQNNRGFEELARDLQQARNQQSEPNDPQAQLRRLLAEKMGRAPKTASTSSQSTSSQAGSPSIGRPGSTPPPATKRPATSNAFEPDRTAASTFMPSSVTSPNSLEQNRVIEASFERSLNKSNLEPRTIESAAKTRTISGTTFSSQDAVRAVIWSEVLGAPKSRRR
jgi:hypothetical protein